MTCAFCHRRIDPDSERHYRIPEGVLHWHCLRGFAMSKLTELSRRLDHGDWRAHKEFANAQVVEAEERSDLVVEPDSLLPAEYLLVVCTRCGRQAARIPLPNPLGDLVDDLNKAWIRHTGCPPEEIKG